MSQSNITTTWAHGEYTPEAVDDLRRQYETLMDQKKAQAPKAAEPFRPKSSSYSQLNGVGTHTTHQATTVYAQSSIPADHVHVEGLGHTSIKAAIAAGLLPHGWQHGHPFPPGFPQPAAGNIGQASGNESATPSAQEPTEAEPNDPEFRDREASVSAATATLEQLDGAIGAEVVTAALTDAIASGELDLTALPEGVTEGQAETIRAGYVAAANNTLSQVNSSVTMLEEMLRPEELQAARGATVEGNNDLLKHLGNEATSRLARMPYRDPEGFAAMLEGMRPDERKALKKDRGGHWYVQLPDGRTMSFGAAVKQGIARF